MMRLEHDLQVACVNWFRLQYPRHIIYAIPNGGQRNKIVASKLKKEGVLSGIPDLHIPVPNKIFHGLYIELKIGRNKPSENQINMIERLRDYGYRCEVCYSVDEFIKIVNYYLK